MKSPIAARRNQAFTLIELLISAAMMAVILGAAYACLSAGFSGQRVVEPRSDTLQKARIILQRISADLRAACPLPRGAAFLGVRRTLGTVDADNLDFATHHHSPRNPGEGDFCEESLFVERNPAGPFYSLWRRRNPTLAFDPLSGGSREELADGLRGFRLEYFDGEDWYDSWGDTKAGSSKSQLTSNKPNSSGLPEAVRITLWLDPSPARPPSRADAKSPDSDPPLMFQTVVRLNLPTGASATPSSNPATTGGQPQGIP
jgi:prepilin-type N-terminal cleavage/methylation domain-containing protein